MAVSAVNPVMSRDGSWNALWQRHYTLKFRVQCDSRYDGPVVIRQALLSGNPWLPRIGSIYFVNALEFDTFAFLNNVSYECESASESPEHAQWLVTCEYGPYDTSRFGPDPSLWPLRVSFAGQKYERAVDQDQDGNAITNSAFCPFAEPVTIDDSRSLIVVKRNEFVSGFSISLAELFRDKINLNAWNGFAAKTVKVNRIETGDAEYDSNSGRYYYTVNYEFEINRDTWVKELLDQGFSYLDGSTPPKAVSITDGGAQVVSDAQLLDGSGHVLATTGTPVFLVKNVYPTVDFSGLQMDLSSYLGNP